MRFDYALLADFAQVINAKLYVQGGGLTRITALTLPFGVPVAIAMRLEAEPDIDLSRESQFEVVVVGPDGETIFSHQTPVTLERPQAIVEEGERPGVFIALTLSALVMRSYGPHRIDLTFDDARTEMHFAVVRPPD